jgi:death-on-curing family protein
MIQEITIANKIKIYTLTEECVIHLHELLSKNYHLVDKMDPVEPPGVKNHSVLASSVFRQHTGSDGWYKYDTPFKNCATLIYGIIKNHPFHNGNKRVAFLAMIKHLFENGYVVTPDTKHDDIYDVLLAIADNNLEEEFGKFEKGKPFGNTKKEKWSDEKNIEVLAHWLRSICESKNYCIKSKVRVQKLNELLEKKGVFTEINGTWLTLYQLRDKKLLGFLPSGKEKYNIKTYGMGNSLSEVGIKVINQIRRDYGLTHKDGFDNISFYDTDTFLDQEMLAYKKLIYKLSQT